MAHFAHYVRREVVEVTMSRRMPLGSRSISQMTRDSKPQRTMWPEQRAGRLRGL